jgi:hypothetical protein
LASGEEVCLTRSLAVVIAPAEVSDSASRAKSSGITRHF